MRAKYKRACTGLFSGTYVLCALAKTKAGVILGQRLRDDTVSFPRAVDSWAEVRVVRKRWVHWGVAPCARSSEQSECPRLVSAHTFGSFPRALSPHEHNETYVPWEEVIYIQKHKFISQLAT